MTTSNTNPNLQTSNLELTPVVGSPATLSKTEGPSPRARTAARIAKSAHLPTLPHVANQLLQFAQQEQPDFDEMARVIRYDPAISGKLLTTVNSALFGFRTRTESIEKAIPKLGASLVRTLILGFHLGSYQPNHALVAKILPDLWQNFLTQGVIAEMIAESVGMDESRCFLAGMVQDIGILALVSECPQEYIDHVMALNRLPNVLAAESSYFGFNHIDVSLEIIKKWNIGDDFNDALRHHHDHITDSKADDPSHNSLRAVLQAAHMGASFLLGHQSRKRPDACRLTVWQSFVSDHFGFDVEEASQILTDVGNRVEETSVVFGVETGNPIDSAKVASIATNLLQEIAIKSQVALTTNPPEKNSGNKPDSPGFNKDELYRDYLSGLRNRRFLSEVLKEKIAYWIRKRKSLAMLFIDVDGFKQVNDVHGHSTGDRFIQHIAGWLEKSTREDDFVLRLGGDEFLIAAQIKHAFCEKLCRRLVNEAPKFATDNQDTISVSMSIGCVFYEPSRNDQVDPNWIIDQADQLMYSAKRDGGEHVKTLRIDGKQRLKMAKTN